MSVITKQPQQCIVHWKNTKDNYLARKFCSSYSEATAFALKLKSRKHIDSIAINVYQLHKVVK